VQKEERGMARIGILRYEDLARRGAKSIIILNNLKRRNI